MKGPKHQPSKSQLLRNVETHSEAKRQLPGFDASDSDPLSYVEEFLLNELPMGTLQEVDLLTPESAAQALAAIERQHRLVQSRLKTSNALRKMLQSYQPPPVDSEQH